MSEATSSEGGPERESAAPPAVTTPWRLNALLFGLTVVSVILTGIVTLGPDDTAPPWRSSLAAAFHPAGAISHGLQFAGSLLLILVAHELGHYVAARLHKVDASLPFFIPLPILSPFGTMGAVIRMRGVIPTRRALLDIGASGPLAGLCFAIPLYIWGAAHSHLVVLADGGDTTQLGESVLVKLIDHFVAPPVPEGMDLLFSPVAFGAWGGMFVTMINLLPVGQLDGGHVAYSLFGPKQDRYAQLIHRSMLVFFFVVVFGHIARDLRNGLGLMYVGRHLSTSMFWLVWFNVLAILGTLSRPRAEDPPSGKTAGTLTIRMRLASLAGLVIVAMIAHDNHSPLLPLAFFVGLGLLIAMEIRGGTLRRHDLLDHPATAAEPLDLVRAAIAVVTLLIFGLLFMPEPFSM